MTIKPILFNTEMVRAFLEGRKTVTRRVMKPRNSAKAKRCGYRQGDGLWVDDTHVKDYSVSPCWIEKGIYIQKYAPYHPGEILYVRETWRIWRAHRYDADAHIEFKAGLDGTIIRFPHGGTDSANRKSYDDFISKWGVGGKWHPSTHMPREAARIFLRVTDVRVERLQDVRLADCLAEGVLLLPSEESDCIHAPLRARERYTGVWNSTIKPADRALYGWDANPWVWIIEFERISREEVADV